VNRFLISVALVVSATSVYASDVDNVYRLGDAAKKAGLANDFKVSGWSKNLDLFIGSMLPGDARAVADGVCQAARQMRWERPWNVRVFLVVGDRPAAACQTQ
jgi:hypothetical protein